MSIAFVGTPSYQHYDSFVENSHTLSVTVPSGAQALLIGATINNDVWTQLTSITFNGSSTGITQAGTTPALIANRSARWWYLLSPPVGTYNLVMNYTTSSNNAGGIWAGCITGADGSAFILDDDSSSTGSGSSPLTNTLSNPDGTGLALVAAYADTAQPSPISGQTTLGTDEANHSFSYKLGGTTMGVTFSGNPQIAQAVIVVAEEPVTGYTITLDAGSYATSGQSVDLKAARTTELSAGTYTLTGQDINLVKATPGAYSISLDAGAYTITGSDALIDLSMNLEAGSYVVGGQDVTFTQTFPQAYSLALDAGAYTLLGRSINLIWSGAPPSTGNLVQSLSMSMRMGM